MSELPKVYVFLNGGGPGLYHCIGLAEAGTVLAQHGRTTEEYAPHDLGVTSDWKHDLYREHYPDGFEVEFVYGVRFKAHEGVQAAVKAANAKEALDED